MVDFRIKLASPDIHRASITEATEIFQNIVSDPSIGLRKFESLMMQQTGASSALALNSGTAALHLALKTLGIQPGDEVLCQSFTFIATANAISYLNATPVFVDSERDSWNVNPELLELAILDRIKHKGVPKALVVVHTYGMPAKIEEIAGICEKYGILLIEDAAGALGSTVNGRSVGTFGDAGIISFNYNKVLTTSGGGLLITNNEKLREKAAYFATQAKTPKPFYYHRNVGYNYQMNGMASALGISQLKYLEDKIQRKRAIFDLYKSLLGPMEGVEFQPEAYGSYSNRWLTTILFEDAEVTKGIINSLLKEKIEARPLWFPMHSQPVFANHLNYNDDTATHFFEHGLALPSGTGLKDEEIHEICQIINTSLQAISKV